MGFSKVFEQSPPHTSISVYTNKIRKKKRNWRNSESLRGYWEKREKEERERETYQEN